MKKENPTKREAKKTRLEFDARLLENEVWLTTEQITSHLNISRSTLCRLRKKHNLPSFKLGGDVTLRSKRELIKKPFKLIVINW